MKRICEWTGTEIHGPALLIPTTEGSELVDPAALRSAVALVPQLLDTVGELQTLVHLLQGDAEYLRGRVNRLTRRVGELGGGTEGESAEDGAAPEPADDGDQGDEGKAPAKKTAAARKGTGK